MYQTGGKIAALKDTKSSAVEISARLALTSTPSAFRAFCLVLCLARGSNGNQKGHIGRSRSSALMTLAARQTGSAHPTRPDAATPSLRRVSSEGSHLAVLCDFPLRKQPNHFLVDTLISRRPRSLPVSTFEYSRVCLGKHRRSDRFQPEPEQTCQQSTPRSRSSMPKQ